MLVSIKMEKLIPCVCAHGWQISYLVMFVYISITLGDYTPSVAPFYVTSKVNLLLTPLKVL